MTKVVILKDSVVYKLGTGKEKLKPIRSKKDFKVDLSTCKLGQVYYKVKDSIYRTAKHNVRPA